MTNKFESNTYGKRGLSFEYDLKVALGIAPKIAKVGRTDIRKGGICYEAKSGAGELGVAGEKLVKGSRKVIYCPVVDENLPVERQEAFVLDRVVFLDMLDELGLIRSKVSSDGIEMTTIQTFWNHSKNAPHSKKKYEALMDALYTNCEMELADFLAQWEK